jgi:hypothetical protein
MRLGQETPARIPFYESERLPNAKEREMWERAMKIATRTVQKSYLLKYQWAQVKTISDFAKKAGAALDEPRIAELADRMFAALKEIETLKDVMCKVNQNKLGVRMSANGQDLDIVQPGESEPVLEGDFGWIIPVIILAIIVIGIIARWIYLEDEVGDLNDQFDGVIERSDKALCKDPNSQQCQDWQKTKADSSYYKRETIIDKLKNAAAGAGGFVKSNLKWGLIVAVPLLLMLYAPRRKG